LHHAQAGGDDASSGHGYSTPRRASTIVPGSAEDLRVNVGDTVHFAYNEYNIEDNDKATLQRQAAWLAKISSIKVTVEGDCDERGTREYNLALGAAAPMRSRNISSASASRAAASRRSPMARNIRCARNRPRIAGPRTAAASRDYRRRELVRVAD